MIGGQVRKRKTDEDGPDGEENERAACFTERTRTSPIEAGLIGSRTMLCCAFLKFAVLHAWSSADSANA